MKVKILNLLIIVASLFGYLEWGSNNNSSFLYEGEFEVLHKLFTDPGAAIHPLTLIPLLGQVLLLITLFQSRPSKYLTYAGIACLGCLLCLMTFIGIIDMDFKILLSTLPFLICAVLVIREFRKQKKETPAG